MDPRNRNDQCTADGSPEWRKFGGQDNKPALEAPPIERTLKDVVTMARKILGDRIGYVEKINDGFLLHPKAGEGNAISITDLFGTFYIDGMDDADFSLLQKKMKGH